MSNFPLFSRPIWLVAFVGIPLVLAPLQPALAQSSPGYFIPPAARAPAPTPAPVRPGPRAPASRAPAAVQPLAPQGQSPGPVAGPGAEDVPALQMQLPPAPEMPALGKAPPPPAPVIGVLGIPEIMRASTAAQQVEKVIGERREKLNEDAQKEQLVWREMQQALANDRTKLSADQIRGREKELQDRITSAQKTFRDRNRIIQEAGQYGLAQIERMLVGVIRQVAESRGMNLVLHRAQVALNVNEFDVTEQVAEQLNRVLPAVSLPADGIEPPMASNARSTAQGGATPASAPAQAGAPVPAAMPDAAGASPAKP